MDGIRFQLALNSLIQLEAGSLGFRVWGLGFRVWGLGLRVWDLGFTDSGRDFLDVRFTAPPFLVGPRGAGSFVAAAHPEGFCRGSTEVEIYLRIVGVPHLWETLAGHGFDTMSALEEEDLVTVNIRGGDMKRLLEGIWESN